MAAFDVNGLLAPVFTPVNDDGRVDLTVIPEYARYLSVNNVDGILVGGTTGEATSLSVEERKETLEAWVAEAKPLGLRVIAQVGGVPLPDVLHLAKHAEYEKVDGIMTLPELYFKPKTSEQLVRYLEEVSTAAPSLPLVYYHFPMMSGVDVNVVEFFKMATSKIPNFKGMKADLGVAMQVNHLLHPDQRIFIANHLLGPAAFFGHDSSIATVTNLFPSLVRDLVDSTRAGDGAMARELQEKLNGLVTDIGSQGDFVPCMKAAMELVSGIHVGAPRRPLTRLDAPHTACVLEHLNRWGVQLANQ